MKKFLSIPKEILLYLVIAAVFTAVISTYFVGLIGEYNQTIQMQITNQKLIGNLDEIYGLVQEQNISKNAFILTKSPQQLAVYKQCLSKLSKKLLNASQMDLEVKVIQNKDARTITKLKDLIEQKNKEMDLQIKLALKGDIASPTQRNLAKQNIAKLQSINKTIKDLKLETIRVLQEKSHRIENDFKHLQEALVGSAILVFTLLSAVFIRLWQENLSRKEYQEKLFSINTELEDTVKERTHQLEKEKEALLENIEFTNAITNSLQEGVYCIDLEKNINFINTKGLEILEYNEDEILHKNAHQTIHYQKADGSDYPISECPLIKVIKDGIEVKDLEDNIVTKSGKSIPVIYNSAPIVFNNKMVGAVVSFKDISIKKAIQNALEESEAKFRNVTEALPQMVWIADAEGKAIYFNKRWTEYTGLSSEESVNATGGNVLHPQDTEKTISTWQKSVETGSPFSLEYRLKDAYGNYRWFLAKALPFKANNNVLQWFGSCTDIEEVVQARELIAQNHEKLEALVEQRTAELQTANKELEAFSYSISHDLRSPLRSIAGFSQALIRHKKDLLDEEGQNYLDRILANANRMGQLIDDILQFSRLNRSKIEETEVNLSSLATEINSELQEQNPDKIVELKTQDNLLVSGDQNLLRLVLQNLLENAWKFTSHNENAVIEVGTDGSLQEDVQRKKQIYYVRDNGVGFDMTYADKLFGLFQRLHAMDEFPGTGVGLATVQRIIARHEGKVWAESTPGQGATFYFTLYSA